MRDESPHADPKLAERLGAALKQLPPIPAPSSLLPNVLAVIAARIRRPWWRRAWWDWPAGGRAVLIAAAAAVIVLLGTSTAWLGTDATEYSRQLTERLVPTVVVPTVEYPASIDTVMNAGSLVWKKAIQPQIHHFGIGLSLLYLACIGLGTAFVRIALKRL